MINASKPGADIFVLPTSLTKAAVERLSRKPGGGLAAGQTPHPAETARKHLLQLREECTALGELMIAQNPEAVLMMLTGMALFEENFLTLVSRLTETDAGRGEEGPPV